MRHQQLDGRIAGDPIERAHRYQRPEECPRKVTMGSDLRVAI
jgi:hypothetical protein